ncbi:MAG: DUF3576 domain-containing protein [Lactobacillus sp.]|jgi:hypothetical protein|nr:DUF3576 domain-containing protein [Lactobacillus sp.]
MKRVALSFVLCALLSGCYWSTPNVLWSFEDEPELTEEQQLAEELGVNPYLWQATLTKLNFMPLQTADSKGGIVITEWVKMSDNSDEAFKVNVNILSHDLRADGLSVKVFKRIGGSAERSDARLAAEIEKSILVEARHILRRKVAAGEG